MYGVVVLIDKKVQTLLDFRKAGELLQVGNRQPFVTQRAKPPFNFLYEYSYKKFYTKDFFIRIFLKRALDYSILS